MSWKAPKIVEIPVGMEINMYACAARGLASSAGRRPCPQPSLSSGPLNEQQLYDFDIYRVSQALATACVSHLDRSFRRIRTIAKSRWITSCRDLLEKHHTTPTETTMTHLALRNASFSSTANRACIERHGLSRLGYTTMAALVLAVGAFISTEPAAAASAPRATYCLLSDSQSNCGFTSLAQCEATASGGLGVCNSETVWPGERGPEEFSRSRAALRIGPR